MKTTIFPLEQAGNSTRGVAKARRRAAETHLRKIIHKTQQICQNPSLGTCQEAHRDDKMRMVKKKHLLIIQKQVGFQTPRLGREH
jgi:hypothetical protein